MTGRTDEIRSQMNGLLKQAVVQVEGMAGPLTRAMVERFDIDPEKLVSQRNQWLGRLGAESARLAEQEALPLPQVVKNALGHVQAVCDAFAESEAEADDSQHDAEVTVEAAPSAPRASTSKPRRKASGSGPGKTTGKRPPRKRSPKTSH